MKLSLTVEADTVNILALNMGRIAVDIDGIELADLIDVVSDNSYSLRVASAPGKLVVEEPLPPVTHLKGIQCSTAHITREDNAILDRASLENYDRGNSDWILYTGYGYILRLGARQYPVLEFRRQGLSKSFRRLVTTLMKCHNITLPHLDTAGEILPDTEVFCW